MTAWTHNQLMGWIQRIEAKAPRATLFELLELGTTADSAAITGAFHRIAGGAHPDLHRHAVSAQDLDRLVSAYGKIAAAYDTLRDPKSRDRYRKDLADRGKPMSMPPVIGGSQAIPIQRPVGPSAALAGRTTGTLPSMLAQETPMIGRTTTPPGRPGTMPPRAGSPSTAPVSAARSVTPGTGVPRIPTPGRGVPITPPVSPTPARGTPSIPPATASTRTTGPRATVSPTTPAATPASARDARTDTRTPLITPGPEPTTPAATRAATRPPTRPPSTTASPIAGRRPESRPPTSGVGPRAQAYFRKAQACLGQGDLGGAMFNLRLAAAADPGSALIKVALAEVESEILGRK